MAKLKIYNEITDETTKTIYEAWFGIQTVCFNDINSFIEQMGEDDNDIDLYLHCPGGSCIEGFAIYDALRTSGKKITAIVDGLCASMATIILMAAPKERRFAKQNASFCIHNPYIPDYGNYKEVATADELDNLAKKVQIQADDLRETQERILDIYVERTGSAREELQSLMDEDRFVNSDRALELGLIGEILEPNTDIKKMNKVTVEASLFAKALAKLGIKKIEDLQDMVITAADGSEITIDRNEGDPEVGGKATPDGQFVMANGSTITIADGVITSIEEPKDEKDAKIVDLQTQLDALTSEKASLASEIEALKANVAPEQYQAAIDNVSNLEKQITDLNAEKDTLAEKVESLTADAKTDSDKAILAKVGEIAGEMDAMQWLDMASKASSTFIVNRSGFEEHHGEHPQDEPVGSEYLAQKRASRTKAINI